MALYLFLLSFNLLLLKPTISFATQPPQSKPKCLLFNFGDGNTDTGGRCAAFGEIPPAVPGHPADCRASNGRFYLDFLCEILGSEPLRPYMDSLGSNFTNGANLAIIGMPAQPMPGHCFPLTTQVKQYAYFQHRVWQLRPKGQYEFRNAIFTVDIGQNDHSLSLLLSHQQIIGEKIPAALQNIEKAIRLGARKFVIYNTGPLGCLPRIIESGKNAGRYLRVDRVGCLAEVNEFARVFNDGLSSLSANLRSEMKEAIIVYIDMFAIKYNLIANSSNYGFENPLVSCRSQQGSMPTVCLDPSRAVNWDGLHYTDAANKIIASMVDSGDYASPYMKLQDLCALAI